MGLRLVSWNVARRDLWGELADLDVDVALLQEVRAPQSGGPLELIPGDLEAWSTAGHSPRPWRTAVARTSERVELSARPSTALHAATGATDWTVGRAGSITAADVSVDSQYLFTAVSVYVAWEFAASRGYADAEAHRVLSDLTALMGGRRHRLVIAGDWNILYGYGEHGSDYWKARYDTVFDRAEALGLRLAGPWFPHGRRADPWPEELPPDSVCVPTFHHSRQSPTTASRQLDFVFVSACLADAVTVTALNESDQWGSSDHCRIVIDVEA